MRSAERREQLLDVTLDLVVERGFHAVTIEAVAQGAGVTRPIVYKQFTDLSGLVEALIDREEDRAISQLARAIPDIPGDRDPDDLLVEGLQLYLEAVSGGAEDWQLILLPPEGVPAIFAERTNRTRRNVLKQLEKLVAWGIERRGGPQGPGLRAVRAAADGDGRGQRAADPHAAQEVHDRTHRDLRADAYGRGRSGHPPPR